MLTVHGVAAAGGHGQIADNEVQIAVIGASPSPDVYPITFGKLLVAIL
jgi:hypothetical protein